MRDPPGAGPVGIALDLVLYLKTQFNTRNTTRGFNLGFISQVSNQVYNPGIIGYYLVYLPSGIKPSIIPSV